MTQKNRFLKSAGVGLTLSTIFLSVYSCIDPLYDLSKGISMDMQLGGDSLAIPIGSTDTIMLKDFLDLSTQEMLKAMEDGGYAITMSDSMKQPIAEIDQSKLRIDDRIDSINKPVDFGDLSLDKFKIPGVSKSTSVNLGLSTYSLGNFQIPSISSSTTANAGMSGYGLSTPTIADLIVNANQMNLLSGITLPPDPGVGTTELPIANQDPVTVSTNKDINYSVSVPAGVSNISNVELKNGATFEVTIELSGASNTLTAGSVVPDITIDPKDLFVFTGSPAGTKITFSTSDSLTKVNGYSVTKSLPISMINIEGNPVAGKLQVTKNITASGGMSLKNAVVRSDRLSQVGEMDMLVTVSVKNVEINSMEFDIPTLNADIAPASTSLNINNTIPDQIQKLNKVLFNDPATITITLSTEDMPVMKSSTIMIDNLSIHFPEQFVFEPMAGLSNNTFTISNEVFNTTTGRTIQLTLKELNMSSIPIVGGVLAWNGSISYNGQVSFSGRINSKNIPTTSSDAKMKVQFGSSIVFNSAEVTTNKISVNVPTVNLSIPLSTDISDKVKSLGVIKMKPNTLIRVDLTKPTLPLTLSANNLQVTFPSEFSFNPPLIENKLVLNGSLEDSIVLVLDALNINKDLTNGQLNLNANISVSGGVDLMPGNVNSSQIESLAGKTMTVDVSTSEIGITSTSIQLKDLAFNTADSIPLNFEFGNIPSLLTSLDSVLLKDNAYVQLAVDISNMPNFGSPLNVDLVVDFPDMLLFVPGEVNAKNQLIMHEAIVDGKLNKTIKLRGMKFDGSDLNGVLKIDKQLKYSAGVSVNSPTVNSDELIGKVININVKAKIANIAFKSVYGELNPDLAPQPSTIPLESTYKTLQENNVEAVLDITKPVISVRTESNLGIPINAKVTLTPNIGGSPLSSAIQTFTVNIPKAESPLNASNKLFWISPDSAGMPTGSDFIKTNIQNLFRTIPENITMVSEINVDKTKQHFFDLTASYFFNLFYDVTVPLAFGEELKIKITKDISGIDPQIGEKAKAVGGIEVLGSIQNSIPLELELALIPLDEDNNRIPIDTVKQIISAGAYDGSAVTSNLTLKLKDPEGLLKDLRAFRLIFSASSNETVAGTPIKSENFIKADLKVRVDGGINIEKLLNK
ncbi:MAG TPA: hypothetical protein VFP20_02200 [Bacteroidales bacterium]|nr:hypothetical protein [Bacteroidales bacterium]